MKQSTSYYNTVTSRANAVQQQAYKGSKAIIDNRPSAVQQRKLQASINSVLQRVKPGRFNSSSVEEKRETESFLKIKECLEKAAKKYNVESSIIATQYNIDKLKKPLRIGWLLASEEENTKWINWSNEIFNKISSGALDLVASLRHWQNEMSPAKPSKISLFSKKCRIVSVELMGSDLHDKGLGAVKVEFRKSKNVGQIFKNCKNVTVIIKPEDRSLEKALLGQQDDSLANQINKLAELDENKIQTIEMETHPEHGSVIKFVEGKQAKEYDKKQKYDSSMTEAIVFSFLAGISDLNRENIIWKDGKPYLIDADCALNISQMTSPSRQNGFICYNEEETDIDLGYITRNIKASRSTIIQKLLEKPDEFFKALDSTFTGKQGRIVPIHTDMWAATMFDYQTGDDNRKNQVLHNMSELLRNGRAAVGNDAGVPGFINEVGISESDDEYDLNEEKAQIKADYERGQIPFYTYNCDDGWVRHNGKKIWRGRSRADAINALKGIIFLDQIIYL